MTEEIEEPFESTEVEKPEPAIPEIEPITIRSYPKTVHFYPMAIMSLVIGSLIVAFQFFIPDPLLYSRIVTLLTFIWLVIFFFNLLLVTFDFGKNFIVAIILVIVIVVLATALYASSTGTMPIFDPSNLGLVINANSMLAFIAIFCVVIFIAWIRARLYYVKIFQNEIVFKKGILGDVERYGTTNVMFYKEIPDIFEYLLLRSGRLTFTIPGRKTTIVLDNVPNINGVEKEVLVLLRRIEVDVD
jgi:hypothetical protein